MADLSPGATMLRGHIPVVLHLRGQVEVGELERSLAAFVGRRPMGSRRRGRREARLQVLFNLESLEAQAVTLRGVQRARLHLRGDTAMFDLTLTARESLDGPLTMREFSTELYDRHRQAHVLAFRAPDHPRLSPSDIRLSELPLLDEAQRHMILVDWNRPIGTTRDNCIHETSSSSSSWRATA